MKLEKNLWKVLRQHSLVLTPLEQRHHIFSTSEPFNPGLDTFSINVMHALRGSMTLSAALNNIQIRYVQGGETSIDMLYSTPANLLSIHKKWLDFAEMHRGTSCEFFML